MTVPMKKVIFALVLGLVAMADERPVLPTPGVDMVLTQGKSAREFFVARAQMTACRAQLKSAEADYLAEKKKLNDFIASGKTADTIDTQEAAMVKARGVHLTKVFECGDCAAQEVEQRKVVTAARTEIWYIADGSCQLPSTEPEKVAKFLEKLGNELLLIKHYSKRFGGFYHILELLSLEVATGKHQPEKEKLDKSPAWSWISVRGPEIFGQQTGFSYLFEANFHLNEKEFVLSGASPRRPLGFQVPAVKDVLASGKVVDVRQLQLPSVLALWYVSNDGYLRYYSAADFGISTKFIEEQGKVIMLDTVTSLFERRTLE